LLAAIDAEQNRYSRPVQPGPQALPAEPRRIVQQTAEPAPQPSVRAGADNPAIAELLGLKSRAQAAPPPPRPAPQRERQVQQIEPHRVARSDSGLAGAFSLR